MKYIKITKDDIANGPGVRVVLWVAGCEHQCEGCHNPETWNFDQGQEFTTETVHELMMELGKHYVSGITLTGGDPLAAPNRADSLRLISTLAALYGRAKTIWVYTGYTWEELNDIQEELALSNVVLVEGRFDLDRRDITLPFRGSSNQRIVNCNETYRRNKVTILDNNKNFSYNNSSN